MIHYFYY